MLIACLDDVLRNRELSALFQPIICMRTGAIHGYEGLIRGPSDTPLHSPFNFFKTAHTAKRVLELDHYNAS